MPKRTDIKKILIIGSGPIVIGQACEFDYSGTQACKALKKEGYEIILVNSNPATIMTDPQMADKTYIEPLTVENMEKIIIKERPDALLPNLGGQTGLNLSSELSKKRILDKYNVELIGVSEETIQRGEDRIIFKETVTKLNIPVLKSSPAYSVEEAERVAQELGYPVVLRPAYTMGGTGGGIAYNVEELRTIVVRGLSVSPIGQVLIEESVLGWEEHELEVVRDAKGNKITVCFIENVDPMGVHTGDSFCVAPMLTVSKELQEKLQEMSYRIVEAIGVLGGCNVQFAHNPQDGRVVIIEINPRTSRSSALASKATGFPIALISAKLAVGITLDELPYWKEGTLDKYVPSGDYVVVKFPRWAFEKFPQAEDKLFTQMQAVGEVMSIGKNFKEAFQKAIRSLEIKRYGLGGAKDFTSLSLSEIRAKLVNPSSERIFLMYEALRKGISVDELYQMTKINKWFIGQMQELVEFEKEIKKFTNKRLPQDLLIKAKEHGFSDRYLAQILSRTEKEIHTQRLNAGKIAAYEAVPVSGADAAYYFSTYLPAPACTVPGTADRPACAGRLNKRKIMILGGGPNRIGQGIEFDYTCVHAAFTLREEGIESVMVNCNPETVSTDYDTSDKLYFEPLIVEDVLSIYEKEKPDGVIVQFGGQTPLDIAKELYEAGVKILGTSPESIHLAEDRQKFKEIIQELNIPQPESGVACSVEEALIVANKTGYPLMMRPSFVLGGRGMQVVYNEKILLDYVKQAIEISPEYPLLIDKFLEQAIEVEVDAISDGEDVYIPTVMEHIELAGIHSGDSACVIPARSISKENLIILEDYTRKIAKALGVVGLMNIQYAIVEGKVYVLEANPRASRTVPIVSKVMGISMAKIATLVLIGKKLKDIIPAGKKEVSHIGVKEAVFPFNMFPAVDPILGPEMRATGEVMGIDTDFGRAFYKAQLAAHMRLPQKGTILITIADKDKPQIAAIARVFDELGFKILSTSGTKDYLEKQGIKAQSIFKLHEERPHIVDYIKNKEIDLVINTPIGKGAKYDDSYIRKAAIQYGIPYITTVAGARAAASGIKAVIEGKLELKSIQ
ncbi:carbamoyl-phosphate synthase large subunit [candidate division NPL-UPA2 bacterium Unc8]|uniref:Carbamoyl phosphate synthase large chain n=1 Tax=candidate division NPL-UPA2 bacterium Unc8 TaxID=1980939 RepID=A0A399FY12_UNCN2|nr:Carbamoyl-phosphate synthase large chain [Bacillota bacterium]RII01111.1 MAG: carbamoyl-phosphate synthase large subunit [candidate division NPL-UPA2 bacterium Unc8]